MLPLYTLTNNAIKGGGRISKVRRVMAPGWPARPSAQCYLVVLDVEDAWLVVPFFICW